MMGKILCAVLCVALLAGQAGGAYSPAAAQKACCGKACPVPQTPGLEQACCRLAVVPAVPVQPSVHRFAVGVLSDAPVATAPRACQPPAAAPDCGPPDRLLDVSAGRSPPSAVPA